MIALNKIRGIEHISFWGFIFLFIFDYHLFEDNWGEAVYYTGAEVLTYMLVFYLHYEILLKRILDKNRPLLYFFGLILLAVSYPVLMRISGLEDFFYELQF